MWKATIAGLRAHRVRLGLTALSIVLGVSFVAATFIFTDTLKRTFDSLFGGVYGKISVQVREPSPVKDQFGNQSYIPMPASILAKVSGLPGVEASEGNVQDVAQLVDKHGEAISTNGAPTIGGDYGPVRTISGFSLSEGHPPVGPSQVVIDKGTADHYHFHVGDPIEILFQGPPQHFTVVGIIKFGNSAGLGGATVAEFDLPTAQRLLNRVDTYDTVDLLAKPGVSATALQAQVEQVLPHGYEAVTGAQLAKQNADQVNKGLSFFTDFLLVFALIALFVGSFIILNTFSILVAQRTREYALLRAVGASRRQILAGTLAEAGFVGLIASVLGVAAGAGLAIGLRAIFKASGASFPSYGLVVNARTVVVGLILGTGVSLLASLNPARRASRIAPVAALGGAVIESAGAPVRRAVLGLTLLVVGLVLMFTGLFVSHHNQGLEVGVGIAVTFLGVATLAPFIARESASVLGRPLVRTSGIAGALARQNAMRNPRRTAATASALMIGLALVTMFSVFGQSAKASLDKSVSQNFLGDYVVKTSGANFNTFSPSVEPLIASVPGVAIQSPERQGLARYVSSTVTLTGVDPATIAQLVKVPVTSGQLSSLGHGEMLVDKDTAKNKHWTVGTPVTLDFAKTGPQTLTVGGTFTGNQIIGSNYLVSTSTFDANFTDVFDYVIVLKTAPDANRVAVSAAIAKAISGYPSLAIDDPATVEKDQAGQINQLLTVIDALLALAIIIAVIGIINTLVLSVLERTRELGLLRAVGMTRRQVRRMVRGESVVIALFGAVLGMVVGVGFGAALSKAVLKGSSGVVSIPVSTLIVFLILATIFGVVAAIWPARRAARTNLLSALAFD